MKTTIDLSEPPTEFVIEVANDGEVVTDLAPIMASISDLGGIMLMVYLHGWKHVAENEDKASSDRTMFKEGIKRANVSLCARAMEGNKSLRSVGVYIRWRGRHVPGLLENVFYYLTRNRATRIAEHGSLAVALEALMSTVRKSNSESEIAVIGHSMGARILGRMLISFSDLIRLPNLIVFLNVADHVQSGMKLVGKANEVLGTRRGEGESLQSGPKLVWLTSQLDWATGFVFPVAEWRMAMGHSKQARTHKVKRLKKPNPKERFAFTFKSENWIIRKESPSTEDSLWWNVLAPLAVIAGHNDPKERFRQIVQSLYHLIYDRPQVGCYFEILMNGPDEAREIAKNQIVYQYDEPEEKSDLLFQYFSSSALSDRQRSDCGWVMQRLPRKHIKKLRLRLKAARQPVSV